MPSVLEKAEALRTLHKGPRVLVLANVWDCASARIVENGLVNARSTSPLCRADRPAAPPCARTNSTSSPCSVKMPFSCAQYTGISLHNIRVAVDHLRQRGVKDLANITLFSDGTTVYECTSAEEVVDLLQGGQGVFGIAVSGAMRELTGAIADFPGERADDPRR